MVDTKIKKVETYALEVPITKMDNPPESLPYYQELKAIVFGSYKSVIVKITTDDGTFGIGECMTRLSPAALTSIIHDVLKPVIMNRDPLEKEVLWEEMYSTMMQRGHYKGYMIEAISGVDMALWDLSGRLLNKPVYTLLGGKFRDSIQCYASSIRFKKPKEVVEEVRSVVNEGFKQVKLKIGRGIEEDISAVKLVKEEFGDELRVMVDANSGYNVNSAIKLGRAFEKLDVFWFEEPIPPHDLPGYAELTSKLDIPIAAGESEFTRYGFRDLIEIGHVDIIQPNVGRAGGFSEVKKILAIASAHGIPFAPHTGSSSGVTMAAELHLASSASNFLVYEFMRTAWSHEAPNPLKNEILTEVLDKHENGSIKVPKGAGLGIELNYDAVRKYEMK